MFKLKNSFIYKACKKIETTNVESENLDFLKSMAININENFFYFHNIYYKSSKENYIYTEGLDKIWNSAFGGVLDVNSESYDNDKEDVIGNFGVYFSLFKSFLNDFYTAVAYSIDERVFRFNKCREEIGKITENIKSDEGQLSAMLHFDELYYNSIQKMLFHERLYLTKKYTVDEIKSEQDGVYKKFNEQRLELDEYFSSKKKSLDNLLSENMEKLQALEADTSKVALAKSFEGFIQYLDTKLGWAKCTKRFSFIAMFVSPCINLYLIQNDSFHVIFIRAVVSLVVLLTFSVLFRVSLRQEDQLEQLLYKASNKTSVIYYYEEHRHMLNEENDSEVEKEFYNYLFREIETREWNSPDVGQSIIDIIKAVKSS